MTTTLDLITRIKADLAISGTDYDTQLLGAVQSALRNFRGKRFWFLKAYAPITLLQNTSSIALPSDYSAPYTFDLSYGGAWLQDGNGFNYYTFDRLKRECWTTNPLPTTVPSACATLASLLYVSCLANANFTIACTYYKQDLTLPGVGDTSVWYDDGYDAVRTEAMLIFKRDAQGYEPTQEDGAMAQRAMDNLGITHVAREAGR